jgi:formylmethanofuran dehydrogenase subunit D
MNKIRIYDKEKNKHYYPNKETDDIFGFLSKVVKDEHDVQFFTGVKDINGKDIYEGDRVKLCGEEIILRGRDTFVVELKNGVFKPFDIYSNVVILD